MVWCMIRTMGRIQFLEFIGRQISNGNTRELLRSRIDIKLSPKNCGRAEEDPEADIVFPKTILLAHAKPILWPSSK